MVELTKGARDCLERYLAELRAALRRCPSIDVAEIERDVMEHIESALADGPSLVDATEIRAVIQRLGSPSRWIPPEELSGVQRAVLILRTGPDDLRIGFLSFGLLLGTLVTAAALNLAFGPGAMLAFLTLGVAASFVLARVSLSVVSDPSRAEGWLIYPSLLIVYIPASVVLLSWPLAVAIVAEGALTTAPFLHDFAWVHSFPTGAIAAVTFLVLNSFWWAFLAFVAWRWPIVVSDCIYPFANSFRPGRRLLIFGGVCLIVAVAALAFAAGELRGKTPYF